MTWEIKSQVMGKRRAELVWELLPGIEYELSIDNYLAERRRLQDLEWPLTRLMPGAAKLVRQLHKHSIPMAIAIGSIRRNSDLKTHHEKCDPEKVEIFRLFGDKIMCGDDSEHGKAVWSTEKVVRGNPFPDIFLCAAELIGRNVGREEHDISKQEKLERSKGLVFEDGIPGVLAGKAAGMQIVWVPDPNLLAVDSSLDVTMLSSLEQFQPEEWGLPAYDSDPKAS